MKTLLATSIVAAALVTTGAFAESAKTDPQNERDTAAQKPSASSGTEDRLVSAGALDDRNSRNQRYWQLELRDLSPHLEAWYIGTRSPSLDR